MKPELRKYLEDIRAAIIEVDAYVDLSGGFNQYQVDRRSQIIAERLLIVIGEQVVRVLRSEPDIAITETVRITGFRNRIVHDYDQIDNATVYNILVRHLPILKNEVAVLLNDHG